MIKGRKIKNFFLMGLDGTSPIKTERCPVVLYHKEIFNFVYDFFMILSTISFIFCKGTDVPRTVPTVLLKYRLVPRIFIS